MTDVIVIDPDAAVIADAIRAATGHAQMAVQAALRAGELLTQAKARVPHGQWESWLREHVGVSARSAQNYMRLHKQVSALPAAEAQRVAGLPLRQALQAIAGPTEPERRIQPQYRRRVAGEAATAEVRPLRDCAEALRDMAKLLPLKEVSVRRIRTLRDRLDAARAVLDQLEGLAQ